MTCLVPAPELIDCTGWPPCGLWVDPDSIHCYRLPDDDPCPPIEWEHPPPTAEELQRYGIALINAVLGTRHLGFCGNVDELCKPGACCACGCDGGCAKCCERDEIPVGDGQWPIIPGSVRILRDDPDTGQEIPTSLFRLTSSGTLMHLGSGWPTCTRLFVHYWTTSKPHWADAVIHRLVCELAKLFDPPQRSACSPLITADDIRNADVASGMNDPFVADILRSVSQRGPDAVRLANTHHITSGWSRLRIRG